MSTRDRQVKAYRASKIGRLKIRARTRAVASAAAWVRDEHPARWAKLVHEAMTSVALDMRREGVDLSDDDIASAEPR